MIKWEKMSDCLVCPGCEHGLVPYNNLNKDIPIGAAIAVKCNGCKNPVLIQKVGDV